MSNEAQSADLEAMPYEAAKAFFAELFLGEHHIPGKIKEFGRGWCVSSHASRFATYDFDGLTRLVFLAHDKCVRASVEQSSPQHIKIVIFQRHTRAGSSMVRHPTLEGALMEWRRHYPESGVTT